ncbi:MAG: PilZ domain-containing protein [Deltaproteobacteria bacterium]|nr:PilZ domain-containing protein [Deltaproteobacteria bacterium]
MGAVRLELRLSNQSEWIKMFDPRDWTIFVETDEDITNGTMIRVDLDVGGWLVTLRGTVVASHDDGVQVALGGSERDKINHLNGFVRGGLLNLREKRRLPVRLPVTYGAIEGPANTFTKDINEEGVFLFTDKPLPETSQIHMLVTVPGKPQPMSLMGKVSHTIVALDDEPPGMGIVFELEEPQRADLIAVIRELEGLLLEGKLPTNVIE